MFLLPDRHTYKNGGLSISELPQDLRLLITYVKCPKCIVLFLKHVTNKEKTQKKKNSHAKCICKKNPVHLSK